MSLPATVGRGGIQPDVALRNALPELRQDELKLRAYAAQNGITYAIAEFGGVRTEADTTKLIRWRDEAVAAARSKAYRAARAAGATETVARQKADAAGRAAHYRVAPFNSGFHPLGAAFDIRIITVPQGKNADWAYKLLGAHAVNIGLRWGGYFSRPADPYHFELRPARADVSARWQRYVAQRTQYARENLGGIIPAIIVVGIFIGGLHLLMSSGRS